MKTIEKIEKLIADLTLLVAFLKAHTKLADKIYVSDYHLGVYCYSKKTFSNMIRSLCSGKLKLEKVYSDYYCQVTRNFGDMRLTVHIGRENVCERIVTGTKVVPAQVYEERIEEIVEWKCK